MMNKVEGNMNPPPKRRLKGGLIILGISGAVIGGLYAVATPFVLPAFRKIPLPYVPATARQVDNVFKMLHSAGKTNGPLVDLGSGDGRIVLEAAKTGFQATGYELNPWLVWYSRLTARLQGLNHRAEFHRRDLWKVDLSQYNSTVVFGVPSMMPKLQDKLSKELPGNGIVVACRFPFPDWLPAESIDEGVDTVWCYHKNQLGQSVRAGQSEKGGQEGRRGLPWPEANPGHSGSKCLMHLPPTQHMAQIGLSLLVMKNASGLPWTTKFHFIGVVTGNPVQ